MGDIFPDAFSKIFGLLEFRNFTASYDHRAGINEIISMEIKQQDVAQANSTNLLDQVGLDAHHLHLVQLSFYPIHMVFFIGEDGI